MKPEIHPDPNVQAERNRCLQIARDISTNGAESVLAAATAELIADRIESGKPADAF